MREIALATSLLVMVSLVACKVGPEYERPTIDVPETWSADGQGSFDPTLRSHAIARSDDYDTWWKIFGDKMLDELVDSAIRQNLDVQQAGLRIAASRVQRDVAAAPFLPSLSGSGLAGRIQMSKNGIAKALSGGSSGGASASASASVPPSWFNLFQAGFDASWEIDLFGRVRRSVEAADANVRSAQAARSDALISLAAEIARVYFTLHGNERQRDIALADIKTQEHLQALVSSRNRAGFAPDSDVAAQRAELAAARATLPQFKKVIAQNRNQLALLLALPPGVLPVVAAHADLPALPPEVPVGLPGDLLRRRPDIRQREADLGAATARIGVAKAALFPQVTLGLGAGFQSTTASTLFDWASRFFIGGADVSVPIFSGGKLTGQVRIARIEQQEAVLSYRQAVLNAFHDVDNALIAYGADREHANEVSQQLTAARRSRDLAEARYRSGLSAYIEVLEAERQAHQAEQDLAQADLNAATDLVALFKSLGGGFKDGDAAGAFSMTKSFGQ
jgi:NodT family efflux transporter outer membrane factor (OMF) lipoprotein